MSPHWWWPWKIHQGHQNLINSSVCPANISLKAWKELVPSRGQNSYTDTNAKMLTLMPMGSGPKTICSLSLLVGDVILIYAFIISLLWALCKNLFSMVIPANTHEYFYEKKKKLKIMLFLALPNEIHGSTGDQGRTEPCGHYKFLHLNWAMEMYITWRERADVTVLSPSHIEWLLNL